MNEQLEKDLRCMRRRIRLLLVERHALIAGTAGLGVAGVLVLLSRHYFALGRPGLLITVVAAGLLVGAAWGMLIRVSQFAAARATEKRLDLKERLSSAVALASRDDDEVVRALVEDAAGHLGGTRPKDVFPHRLTREMKMFTAGVLVLVGLFYLPHIPALQSPTRRAEVKVMKEEGERLQELAEEVPKQVSEENRKIAAQIAKNIERLGKDLESGRMTRKQAMLELRKLSEEVRLKQDELAAKSSATKSIPDAARELGQMSQDLAGKMMERIAEEMARQASEGEVDPKLQEMMERLQQMQAGQDGLSDKEMRELGKEISDFLSGQQGVSVPPELASYMAELLKNEDYLKAMELLAELSKRLANSDLSEMDMSDLEEQLKALAEALKDTDLNALAEAMRQAAEALAQMDPEEAAKLLAQCENMGMLPMDLAQLGKLDGG